MCNLYRLKQSTAELAAMFSATDIASGSNQGELVFPRDSGFVIADGEVRKMTWGFPLVLKSKRTGEPLKPKPVNNARTDKLDSYFWKSSFTKRRCLIPVSAWAEAQGQKGSKTRTWLSLADEEIFAVAGLWRRSHEWGDSYSMVMTDASAAAAKVHDRMPVILSPADYEAWQYGEPDKARELCVGYAQELAIKPSNQNW